MTDRELLESILAELKSVKDELKSVKNEVKTNSTELKSVKDEVKVISIQQKEDHLILRALEHSAQVNKAEHDKIINDIAHMSGNMENIALNLDAVKEIIGRHEVDLKVLKNRPV